MAREKNIEKRLAAKVKQLGGWCLKLPAVHVAGLPDRLCLLPGGRVFFIETKTPTGRTSPIQRYVHRKLTAMGFDVFVPSSTGEITKILNLYK